MVIYFQSWEQSQVQLTLKHFHGLCGAVYNLGNMLCALKYFFFDPISVELREKKMQTVHKEDQGDCVTVCLKYLLFVFNFLFWVSRKKKVVEAV